MPVARRARPNASSAGAFSIRLGPNCRAARPQRHPNRGRSGQRAARDGGMRAEFRRPPPRLRPGSAGYPSATSPLSSCSRDRRHESSSGGADNAHTPGPDGNGPLSDVQGDGVHGRPARTLPPRVDGSGAAERLFVLQRPCPDGPARALRAVRARLSQSADSRGADSRLVPRRGGRDVHCPERRTGCDVSARPAAHPESRRD